MPADPTPADPAPGADDTSGAVGARRSQARSTITREALLDAALHEFSAHGFDAASTRAIAARAGVHQPQINYHFESKLELWRAAVDHLFDHLDAELLPAVTSALDDGDGSTDSDPTGTDVATIAAVIRALVRTAHRYPQLNRIIVTEATHDSDRLGWIVERHVGPRFEVFTAVWQRLRAAGRVADIEPVVAYYSLVGATSLLYSNAPEARRLLGHDPIDDALVARHTELVVAMFLRPPDPTTTDRAANTKTASTKTAGTTTNTSTTAADTTRSMETDR